MGIVTKTFTYTGTTVTFTVPLFIEKITIKAWGAGGSEFGGPGGYATGNISVIVGDILNIAVGQGGVPRGVTSTFGGEGPAGTNAFDTIIGSSGGGASTVSKNTSTLLLVAGGGGGGSSAAPSFSLGGSGGGSTGTTAWISGTGCTGGQGGSQVAGGSAGTAPISAGNATAGSSFKGGNGGPTNAGGRGTGGGGGGGFFGGGGGAGQQDGSNQETSGGGGSSFLGSQLTNASTLSTPQNTSTSTTSPGLQPPNTSDPAYVAGVGVGDPNNIFGAVKPGGNGLVVLQYFQPDLINTKTVSETQGAVLDTLSYTIQVYNTGPTTVTNVVFVDTIPNGTTFNANSLTIDGVPSLNNPNPPGFNISSFPPGVTINIQYQVTVGSSLPNPNPIQNTATSSYPGGFVFNSNTVNTKINSVVLLSTKQVNKTLGNIGDILTYTIPITNTGNITAPNILFIDTIPNGTSIVANSLKQDGTLISGSPNPPGVTLPNSIGVNKTTTITFQVKIIANPNPNPIPNNASAISNFIIDNTTTPNRTAVASTNTNTVNTSVNFASLSGITKYVDKSFANCGDTITYTIVAPNSGTVSAQNVVFKDTIPNGTVFVPSSVFVNGINQINSFPSSGITLPNIGPGSTATLTFSVQVQC